MKIIHVAGGLDASHGGPSRSVPRLAGELSAKGEQVFLLHAGSENVAVDTQEAIRSGVTVERGLTRRDAFDRFARLLAQGVHIIHLHGLWNPLLHSIAREASRRALPTVISPRGMLEPWAMNHHRWRKRIAWTVYQRRDLAHASLVHATSEQEAANISDLGLRTPVIIPNGTDLPATTADFKGERNVVFLSRIHPKKGLPMLVEAARELKTELRAAGWRFLLAGPDEDGHAGEIRALIAANGLDDLFSFPGEVDGEAKWDLLRTAHVVILPSHSENFGIVVAEALAAGVPVITTTATPWQELQQHGCGWWVAPDSSAITAALKSAIETDPVELHAMGGRGRALVSARYAWPAIAAQFHEVYASLLRGRIDG